MSDITPQARVYGPLTPESRRELLESVPHAPQQDIDAICDVLERESKVENRRGVAAQVDMMIQDSFQQLRNVQRDTNGTDYVIHNIRAAGAYLRERPSPVKHQDKVHDLQEIGAIFGHDVPEEEEKKRHEGNGGARNGISMKERQGWRRQGIERLEIMLDAGSHIFQTKQQYSRKNQLRTSVSNMITVIDKVTPLRALVGGQGWRDIFAYSAQLGNLTENTTVLGRRSNALHKFLALMLKVVEGSDQLSEDLHPEAHFYEGRVAEAAMEFHPDVVDARHEELFALWLAGDTEGMRQKKGEYKRLHNEALSVIRGEGYRVREPHKRLTNHAKRFFVLNLGYKELAKSTRFKPDDWITQSMHAILGYGRRVLWESAERDKKQLIVYHRVSQGSAWRAEAEIARYRQSGFARRFSRVDDDLSMLDEDLHWCHAFSTRYLAMMRGDEEELRRTMRSPLQQYKDFAMFADVADHFEWNHPEEFVSGSARSALLDTSRKYVFVAGDLDRAA